MPELKRCAWVNMKNPLYIKYHDNEWGKPVKNDRKLFEMLCLEGAQAGLSWETVLNKRKKYKELFFDFQIDKCANLTDRQLEKILQDEGIIRNRLKVYSVRKNAKAAIGLKKEFGSLSKYFWSFVNNAPVINDFKSTSDIPAQTEISEKLSKDLKKRGFSFVGPTIIYAFMQAVGMVNDHTKDCFRFKV